MIDHEAGSVSARSHPADRWDAIVVGAGFAGMYMLYRLRELGFSVRVIETGDDVGGTWYWNCYPGARVDVPSLNYSYSFSPELQRDWSWPEVYSSQPDLLRYAQHVADTFDLRRDIQFNTTVTSASFDDGTDEWRIGTNTGEVIRAQYLITAVGCLSAANIPEYPGLDGFEGAWYHTGRWPKTGANLSGRRVAVIGTGSSGVQAIPVIAEQAAQVFVFQRTPNYSIPTYNAPLDSDVERDWKARYEDHRTQDRNSPGGIYFPRPERSALEATPDERERAFEAGWRRGAFGLMQTFNDLRTDLRANETIAEFVREQIRRIVKDPQVADILCPKDYPLGTKRLCMDSNYFETFNRDNVTLVDLRSDPIVEITPLGLRTENESYELDVIVFATGYDAMTGPLLRMNITGRSGLSLSRKWENGPRSYLGIGTAGFPNLLTITGPGSPSVLTNMIVSIEQHVDFIADMLDAMRKQGIVQFEPDVEAENDWVAHVDEVAQQTLYRYADSWYKGANIDGKPRVFMPYVGGLNRYTDRCNQVAADGYDGFVLSRSPRAPAPTL